MKLRAIINLKYFFVARTTLLMDPIKFSNGYMHISIMSAFLTFVHPIYGYMDTLSLMRLLWILCNLLFTSNRSASRLQSGFQRQYLQCTGTVWFRCKVVMVHEHLIWSRQSYSIYTVVGTKVLGISRESVNVMLVRNTFFVDPKLHLYGINGVCLRQSYHNTYEVHPALSRIPPLHCTGILVL